MDIPSHFFAVAGLIVGLFLWYNHYRRGKSISRRIKGKSPPEPSGAWPIIGHLPLLQSKEPVFITLAAMAEKFGPVFSMRLGMFRTVVVSDHALAKECFTTNDRIFASRPSSAAAKLLGYVLLGPHNL